MDETETKKVHLSPVSGWEAAIRSRARLSTQLRSVPEKYSIVSFVHDIRRRGLGAKYLVFVSSRSVKLRELSLAQFVYFLGKVRLFFNLSIMK